MILRFEGGTLKGIRFGRNLSPGAKEFFVPDDWGTNEIKSMFFESSYDKIVFSIKENPELSFELFDVCMTNNETGENLISFFSPDSPFSLKEVFLWGEN